MIHSDLILLLLLSGNKDMKDNYFDKTSVFDTWSVFKNDFPMLSNCKRSIPPFILPNTVNGACVLFSTNDKSQFIYTMCSHRVYLVGPSKEFVEHFDKPDLPLWIIENILGLKGTNPEKIGDEYRFKYENRYFIIFAYLWHDPEGNSFYYFNLREDI